MKSKILLSAILLIFFENAQSQITITMNDMPINGDTLRSSAVNPLTPVNLSLTGAGTNWNFSSLVPISQAVDTYKLATTVNPLYFGFGTGTFGHKVPDDFFGAGLPVTNLYLFFLRRTTTTPQKFVMRGFGGHFSGTPVPAVYNDEDEWYFLPKNYNDKDSSTYYLDVSFAGNGLKISGTRKTVVDGYGTITTPHFTSPVPCLRIKSMGDEVDSISMGGTPFIIPRKVIDYKWLSSPNEHYPVVWITTNDIGGQETVTSIRFRDHYRPQLGVENVAASVQELTAFPNPAQDEITLQLPEQWREYVVEVFDIQGKSLLVQKNESRVKIGALSSGQYLIRVTSGTHLGFVRITR